MTEREKIYRRALNRIATSTREERCTSIDCESYFLLRLSSSLQKIARDAIEQAEKVSSSETAGR